jgi:hypothetical protein
MTYSGPVNDPGAQRPSPRARTVQVAKSGLGFGSALAIAISWGEHHSILWAIVQGFFGWFYVIWYALTR